MTLLLVLGKDWPWEIDECLFQWTVYANQRFRKNDLSLPAIMEVAMLVRIACLYLKAGSHGKYTEWMDTAILDAAGKHSVQALLQKVRTSHISVDYKMLCEAAGEGIQNKKVL
jgi:hypothetical protein